MNFKTSIMNFFGIKTDDQKLKDAYTKAEKMNSADDMPKNASLRSAKEKINIFQCLREEGIKPPGGGMAKNQLMKLQYSGIKQDLDRALMELSTTQKAMKESN